VLVYAPVEEGDDPAICPANSQSGSCAPRPNSYIESVCRGPGV
jgi:hypothetical protein